MEDTGGEHALGVLGSSFTSSMDVQSAQVRITTSTLDLDMPRAEMKSEAAPSLNMLLADINRKIDQIAGMESRLLPTKSFMESVAGSLAAHTTSLDSLCYAVEQIRAEGEFASRCSRISANKRNSHLSRRSSHKASPNLASLLPLPSSVPTPQDDAPALLNGSSSSYSKQSKVSKVSKVSIDPTPDRGLPVSRLSSSRAVPRAPPRNKKKLQSCASHASSSCEQMPSASAYGMMDELESFTAQQLMHKPRKSQPEGSISVEVGDGSGGEASVPKPKSGPAPKPAKPAADDADAADARIIGRPRAVTVKGEDKEGMLKNCRRLSLDELRENYNQVMARTSAKDGSPKATKTSDAVSPLGEFPEPWSISTALPCVSRILLSLVGILDFGEACCWRAFSRWAHGVCPVILVAVLAYASAQGVVEAYDAEASCFYFAGAILATFSLRRCGLQSLLNASENSLDDYASRAGFLKDWRKLSKRRLVEMLLLYGQMLVCKVAVSVLRDAGPWSGMDVVAHLSIAFMELQHLRLYWYPFS